MALIKGAKTAKQLEQERLLAADKAAGSKPGSGTASGGTNPVNAPPVRAPASAPAPYVAPPVSAPAPTPLPQMPQQQAAPAVPQWEAPAYQAPAPYQAQVYQPSEQVLNYQQMLQQIEGSRPGAFQQQGSYQGVIDQFEGSRPGAFVPNNTYENIMAGINASKPGPYQSEYAGEMSDIYGQIKDRKPFSYDMNADMLYQQMKDAYVLQGNRAMQDTMGQAQGMTGGYGNSYAQGAGQQAYGQQLQHLNDNIPQLSDRAYGRYRDEGQELYQRYGLNQQADQIGYGRHRDDVGDWRAEGDRTIDNFRDERNFGYGMHRDEVGDWQLDRNIGIDAFKDTRNFDYGQYRDQVGDWQTDRNFNADMYQNERNFDYGQFSDDRNFGYNQYNDDRNFGFNQFTDERNFGYTNMRDEQQYGIQTAGISEEQRRYETALAAANTTGKGGGSSRSTSNGSTFTLTTGNYTDAKNAYKNGGDAQLMAYVERMIAQGASMDDVNKLIASAETGKYIAPKEIPPAQQSQQDLIDNFNNLSNLDLDKLLKSYKK